MAKYFIRIFPDFKTCSIYCTFIEYVGICNTYMYDGPNFSKEYNCVFGCYISARLLYLKIRFLKVGGKNSTWDFF